MQQQQSPLQSISDQAVKPGYSEAEGIDAGRGTDNSGFRANRPNTPEATDTGPRVAFKAQEGTAHLTGSSDMQGSWLTQLIGRATHMPNQYLCITFLVNRTCFAHSSTIC